MSPHDDKFAIEEAETDAVPSLLQIIEKHLHNLEGRVILVRNGPDLVIGRILSASLPSHRNGEATFVCKTQLVHQLVAGGELVPVVPAEYKDFTFTLAEYTCYMDDDAILAFFSHLTTNVTEKNVVIVAE